jgi:hypothetical protein
MTAVNTAPFKDMIAVLRQRGNWNANRLAYVKGEWQLGQGKILVNGSQLVARPDWLIFGWTMWWDGKICDFRLGYVADSYKPPERAELGALDKDEWKIWTRGRDPWQLGWTLPLFNQVNGEQVIYQTDTYGGRDCLAALLQAYTDRIDSDPGDGKTLPVVELDSGSYRHAEIGEVNIPLLNIIGWAVPPNMPRPPLPKAEPKKLPAAKPQQAIEGQRASLTNDLDDAIPFAPEWR